MLGDKIHIRPEYYTTADDVILRLLPTLHAMPTRHVIAIGGESGSGKSVLASCLAERLQVSGIDVIVLQLDDYFYLPPADNHAARLADLAHVGIAEVNMLLLQAHLNAFKQGATELQKPISSYIHNRIEIETYWLDDAKVLLIEGTYALLLENTDTKIFINRNYKDTLEQRIARARDVVDDFTNEILEIEHQIVVQSGKNADFVIEKDYSLVCEAKQS
jgi:uridine kinase